MSECAMDKYVFLYRNSEWRYGTTKDIAFIAKHPLCIALDKKEILDKFGTVLKFTRFINKASISSVSAVFKYGNLKHLKEK